MASVNCRGQSTIEVAFILLALTFLVLSLHLLFVESGELFRRTSLSREVS